MKVDRSASKDRPDFADNTVQFHAVWRFSIRPYEFRLDKNEPKLDALEKVDDLN